MANMPSSTPRTVRLPPAGSSPIGEPPFRTPAIVAVAAVVIAAQAENVSHSLNDSKMLTMSD